MPAPFRPDVEGLRALAIVLVLVCHAGVGFAAGGYVGVDVFFVISGFVITRMLVAELDATGRLSLPGFYGRRVKRLMPQALAVMLAVAVAASLLLSPLRADAVAGDVTAAGAYAMNFRLSAGAVDYFATGEDRPLDHFWSLAVEEQFYLAWPLLILAVAWRGGARTHRRLLFAMGAIAGASLLHAVGRVAASPEQAYFSPTARAWELAVGGIVAIALIDRRLGGRRAAAAGWGGAAAIAFAATRFGPATAVPGLPALLPTLGAAGLLVAGSGGRALPSRALASRPARFVGRISYAWYIWHWPVLVFAAAVWGPPSPLAGLAVVAASLVPALASHRWIEEPLRRSTIHLRRPRVTLGAAGACPAFALLCAVALSASLPSTPLLAASQVEGAHRLERTRDIQTSAAGLRPRPRDADRDRGRSYEDGCLVGERATTSPPCVYGDRRAKRTMVLFGDSHAMQLFPALDRIARRRHWRLVQLTKGGCPPPRLRLVYTISGREYHACDAWREYAFKRIATEHATLVVAASSAHYTVLDAKGRRMDRDAGAEALAHAYPAALRRLRSLSGRAVMVGDPPRPPFDVPECVSGSLRSLERCAFDASPALARSRVVMDAAGRVRGVRTIDVTSRFCMEGRCPAVIGDVLVYRNSGHITATYAETLADWMGARL